MRLEKFAENYHDQELETKDFREVVSYIVKHDKKMLRNFKKEQRWIKYLRKSRKINVLINRER